jgi:putative membrane protein insertion efficiency factor
MNGSPNRSTPSSPKTAGRLVLVAPIRLYQRIVSPLIGPRCRFHPSCSEYAVQAIVRHGPLRGLYLAVRRVLRCHPWNPGGIDDVPVAFAWRRTTSSDLREAA